MDAALSLPVLSFLAVPALSSYSTQLNILFFYMTWSTLLLSHSPLVIEFFGTFAIRTIFFTAPSLLFLLFDSVVPDLAEAIKAQGKPALPSLRGGKRVGFIVAISLLNIALGVALQTGVDLLFTHVLNMRSRLRITTTLPLPWGVAKDLATGLVMRGVIQYYIHRYALHDSRSPLTKLHLNWHHSIRVPFSFVANFDHPVCYLVGRWLPVYLPAALFRFHILTYHLLLVLLSLEETFTYSGYSVLPSTIILAGMARRVDGHMMSKGQGNFAPWGLLDWVSGTSLERDVMDDLQSEMEKHDVEGKSIHALDSASDAVNNVVSNAKAKGKGRGKKASGN